jgi:hypothetical protein
LIVKSQPLKSQDLAIGSKPLIPQNSPREEKILPLESPDLSSADFRDGLDFQFHKRPSREYNSNPHEKGSLRKRSHSHQKEFEDGMSSNAIKGESCHTKNRIYYPIMFIDDLNHGPISKPIINFEDPPYAL